MLNKPTPSYRDWRDLYQAAEYFKELKCWEWMCDTNLFAVQDPTNGEIGFCVILGNNQEIYALVVYLGIEGFMGYRKILNGEVGPYDAEMVHVQKCLMASFEDRNYLEKEDLNTIKGLGLKYHGLKSWPFFRSYYPGYYPWFLNNKEIRFLTVALEQAGEIALRYREDPSMLLKKNENTFLLRVKNNKDLWTDDWVTVDPHDEEKIVSPPVNELKIKKVSKNAKRRSVMWLTDIFYSPFPIQSAKCSRPYYPYICLWVDAQSKEIVDYKLLEEHEYPFGYQNNLIDIVDRVGVLPRKICVSKNKAFSILNPVAEKMNVKIALKGSLLPLDNAKRSIYQYFSKV